jgi:hypothetical protein
MLRTFCIFQRPPFHPSARFTGPEFPTATQLLAEAHATPLRPLGGIPVGVSATRHRFPSHRSASVRKKSPCCCPLLPMAMQLEFAVQASRVNSLPPCRRAGFGVC